MTSLRDAAQQALEAMESAEVDPHSSDAIHKAITALRAALAEQAEPDSPERPAEPQGCDHCNHPMYAAIKCKVCGRVTEAVQAPPQRKPLTEDEILKAVGWDRAEMYMKLTPNFPVAEAKKETLKNARAVEAAHGIKE